MDISYGFSGIIALISTASFFGEIISNDWKNKPGVRTVYALTMFTFVVVLLLLSVLPFQDPKMLLPLTVPVVLMNAHKLRYKFGRRGKGLWSKPLLSLWYIFNVGGLVFYVFFHQASINGMFQEFHSNAAMSNNSHVIFSHTFLPPNFPLLEDQLTKLNISMTDAGNKQVETELKNKIIEILLKTRHQERPKNYLIIPTLLLEPLTNSLDGIVNFGTVMYKFPHISVTSLFDASVAERYDTFINTLPDLSGIYSNMELSLAQRGVYGCIEMGILTSFDFIGKFGLSMLTFEFVPGDDLKIVQLKKNFLLNSRKSFASKTTKREER